MNCCKTKISYLNEMTKVWSGKGIKKRPKEKVILLFGRFFCWLIIYIKF